MWAMIISLIIGMTAGFFIGRLFSNNHRQKLQLEEELKEAKQKLADHHVSVTEHFTKTAELVNEMTNSYKSVYEHLANGADNLCTNNPHLGRLFQAKPESVLHLNQTSTTDMAAEDDETETTSTVKKEENPSKGYAA